MCIGNTVMGGQCDFTGKRLVVNIQDFHKSVRTPERKYRLDIWDDTGIVESEYGYHVMYFVKTGDTTFRDYMIENDMRNEDMTEWHEELTKKVSVEKIDMSRMDWGYKFG
jgi:hypothetical protein